MPDYRFIVKNKRGRTVRGVLVAASEADATAQLTGKDFHLLELREVHHWISRVQSWMARLRPVSLLELASTTRQLATLLNAGLGVMRSLDVLNEQPLTPRLAQAWADISLSVQKGMAMSRGMARHPDVFDGMYRGLVKAGESSGALVDNLARLSDVLERELRLRQKLSAALTYPAFVFVICIAATFVLTQNILPTFINGIFKDSALVLPWMTRSVIFVTNFMNSRLFFWGFLPGMVIAFYLLAGYIRTPGGRYRLQQLSFNIPVIREVFIKAACARFARTMGCLLKCGMPLIYSLELADMVLSNYILSRHVQNIRDGLEEGRSMSSLLREVPLFPPILAGFTELGETTGQLPMLYGRLADMFDEELDIAMETATTLMEPIMVGVLGLLVGYVIVAMFIPMYQLLSAF